METAQKVRTNGDGKCQELKALHNTIVRLLFPFELVPILTDANFVIASYLNKIFFQSFDFMIKA